MITVQLLGVDQYLAMDLVTAQVHENLAQIMETKPEDILFYAPDSFLIYKGLEQTSFQLNIVVEAPSKYKVLEKKIARFLMDTFSISHIHVRVLFRYFESSNEYELINPNYPRFMTEDNMAHFDTEEDVEEPYMGNAFEGFDKKIEEREQELFEEERERLAHEDSCDCGHHHDHEDHECCCHHHHE